jgi:hypothetical protein
MIRLSSLGERSPLNSVSGSQVFFVFRLYFDGSGKADDPRSRFVTLACCAAEEKDWHLFEEEWREALGECGDPGYMHMKEVMATPPRGPFREWSDDKVCRLVDRLLRVLRKSPQSPLKLFIFSVKLETHRKWQPVLNLRKPERLCAEWCFYRPIEIYWESEQPTVPLVDAFFDQNEPFLPAIRTDWENKKCRRKFPVLQMVHSMEPVDMKLTPGVQLADMMAWSRNRLLSNPSEDWSDLRYRVAQNVLQTLSTKSVMVDEVEVLAKFGLI